MRKLAALEGGLSQAALVRGLICREGQWLGLWPLWKVQAVLWRDCVLKVIVRPLSE